MIRWAGKYLFDFDDIINRSYKLRFCTGNWNKTNCGHGYALVSTVDNNVTRGTVEFCGVGYSHYQWNRAE